MGAAFAMAFLWLAVCLTPISCLLQMDQDPDPVIKNLRMDPERKRMSWDLHGNVSQIWCFVNSRRAHKARNNTYCKFAHIPCQATNYSVSVTQGPPFSGWIQHPKLEGKARAAAENLTCWVHDADLLTCTWAVGREAPRDTQYHLYLENLHSLQKWPCSQYRQDEWGTNVECRFDDLSVLSPELNRFSVNGSSRESPIPCSEITKTLHEIERLTAPTITSAWCNQTYSIVQWQVRSHFREDFEYELEMQQVNGVRPEHRCCSHARGSGASRVEKTCEREQ